MLVIIDVKPKDLGLPTEAYISVEEIHDVSQVTKKDDAMYRCVMVLLHLLVFGAILRFRLDLLYVCYCDFKDGTPTSKTFEHVTSEIGAEEAEEVGVEHLLR